MARSSQGFSGSRHTFLTPDDLVDMAPLLEPFAKPPSGRVDETVPWPAGRVSDFLSEKVLGHFSRHPLWLQSHPILLGSWGRNELCPKSDLDLLFLGDPDCVLSLITDLQQEGFRIRYRIPLNRQDWSEGVMSTDVLALWGAQGLTEISRQELASQQKFLFRNRSLKKKILKDLWNEREQREKRFDSIQNFLEPQIKFGAGGLRDLFQGLVILDLFAESFGPVRHEKQLLEYYKDFFLTVRQKLHAQGYSDVLVASEQFELAKWFGFEQHSEFMRQIQRGLSRVHFYSQWILAKAQASPARVSRIEKKKMKRPQDLWRYLKTDASILAQYQVRRHMDDFKFPLSVRGQGLKEMLSPSFTDSALQGVFHSRLIDKLCPRIKHLVGLVQHDQYHRFTADAHLLQACRESKRLQDRPQLLGPLRQLHKEITVMDWQILSWTALYHDLGKGLKGEHSEIGENWAREDLKAFGFGKGFREEVAWLVKNHLELSVAAFRKNPHSPDTWQALLDLGVDEKRLRRLALWTAIDIRATNPEAWNDWKAKLLADLVEKIRSGGTQNYLKLKMSSPLSPWVDQMDSYLFDTFSSEKLTKDFQKIQGETVASWGVVRDSQRKLWIRYFDPEDRAGLLSEVVEKIYAAGASIQQALIQTLPGLGVYDWFQVQTQKETQQLLKLLSQMAVRPVQQPKVHFMKIEMVSQSDLEWVLSFRGVDQKGLLLAASLQLKKLGAQIKSARVHTWGRQIEDLFHIVPPTQEASVFMSHLKQGLITDISASQ